MTTEQNLTNAREALEFYADEKRWDQFRDDEHAAASNRNFGSELGRDLGDRARAALRALEEAQAAEREQMASAQGGPHPMVFLITEREGVLFDPQGKFHGWIMRQHPDGLWVTVRKLDAVDPEETLPDFLRAALSGASS